MLKYRFLFYSAFWMGGFILSICGFYGLLFGDNYLFDAMRQTTYVAWPWLANTLPYFWEVIYGIGLVMFPIGAWDNWDYFTIRRSIQ